MGIIIGAALIAGLTLVFAIALLFIRSIFIRWLLAVIVPVLVCAGVYWSAVWIGGDESEYSAWSALVIGVWYVPSYLMAVAFVYKTRGKYGLKGRLEQPSQVPIGSSSLFGREMLGFAVAPLTVVGASFIVFSSDGWPGFGLVAYTAAAMGIPSYLLFRRMDWLGFWRLTFAGAVAGSVMAMWYLPLTAFAFSAEEWRGTLRLPMFLCMSGVLVGAVFWLVAIARFGRGPRETSSAGL